jgi:hypothetical protein
LSPRSTRVGLGRASRGRPPVPGSCPGTPARETAGGGVLQLLAGLRHGNPWLRLLRREVEALARARHGDRYVNEQQARAELTRVNREIRRLRTELAELEERRAKLGSDPGE